MNGNQKVFVVTRRFYKNDANYLFGVFSSKADFLDNVRERRDYLRGICDFFEMKEQIVNWPYCIGDMPTIHYGSLPETTHRLVYKGDVEYIEL
jgi:hypothetical protein